MDQAAPRAAEGFHRWMAVERQRDLLRLLTCGSVDDGKSTLIGRLLHDSQLLYDDHLAAARRDSARHGTTGEEIDFALLVDGLQAEREQGITIDVAYRYFATARRKFIIADTPGHEQYTRNMATGASTANLALILVDARQGILPQTRRHAFIATLLGIRHLVLAVNKMDLVGFSQEVFERVRQEFTAFAARLQVNDVHFIPLSAREGDNVVHPSDKLPWYQGGPLLAYLETVHIASDRNLIDLRFPVQLVSRPTADFRGYAGTLASGILRRGDQVLALPSAKKSRVASIHTFAGELEEAAAPLAVTVTLEDEIDLSRGDLLVHPNNVPRLGHEIEAMVVWMADEPLRPGGRYLLKHTTVQTPATVHALRYRMNVDSLRREPADGLALNEIGRVALQTGRPLAFDAYRKNRSTGSFVLIDRLTNHTVGAGMIVDRRPEDAAAGHRPAFDAGTNLRPQRGRVTPAERAARLGQTPCTVWLTGLPRAGKSSIAFALESVLFARGGAVQVLDGENLRLGLSSDLGFDPADRGEAVRRAAEAARLANDAGLVVLAALVSPRRQDRQRARQIIGPERFVEVWCSAPLEVCEARDPDGLFARARGGELSNVTGVDAPYEAPAGDADLELPTHELSVEESVERVLWLLAERGLVERR